MDPSSAALHLLASKYFQAAAFVMLAYDHIITLGQEVERIWMRPKSFAALLFLLNRYATLIQFIIIVISFNDPGWKGEPCSNYVLFEGTCTIALVAVGQMIMILRVVALYNRNKKIFASLLVLLTAQVIMSGIGLRKSSALPLPTGLVGCILAGGDALGPSMWIAPLITDSSIFLLTVYRTRNNIGRLFTRSASGGAFATDRAITILLRDGVVYFFLIFLANVMNTLIFFLAPPDLKAIGASFSQLLTCTVISRLVLNLRSLSSGKEYATTAEKALPVKFERPRYQLSTAKRPDTIWTRTLNDFTDNDSLTLRSERAASDDIPSQQVEVRDNGSHKLCDEV